MPPVVYWFNQRMSIYVLLGCACILSIGFANDVIATENDVGDDVTSSSCTDSKLEMCNVCEKRFDIAAHDCCSKGWMQGLCNVCLSDPARCTSPADDLDSEEDSPYGAEDDMDKRARHFLGKRARASYFLGKRARNNFLGKRSDELADEDSLMDSADELLYGPEKRRLQPFLGKRRQQFLGKRARHFLGKREDGDVEEVDKRARHFLGKRKQYFLGKREDDDFSMEDKRARHFLGKRPDGNRRQHFLGKRADADSNDSDSI